MMINEYQIVTKTEQYSCLVNVVVAHLKEGIEAAHWHLATFCVSFMFKKVDHHTDINKMCPRSCSSCWRMELSRLL